MTRHAEMERPDEVQEAEFARTSLVHPFAAMFGQPVDELGRIFEKVTAAIRAPRHRRPYSRLRERDIFDPAHEPRHVIRKHRAEVSG